MKNLKEQLELSRKTKLGMNTKVKFQEWANYKLSEDDKCPYCNQYSNNTTLIGNVYETANTIEKTYKNK